MSLQHMILPLPLIAELYKKISLIADSSSQKKKEEIAPSDLVEPLKFLGNNLRKIVIIVRHPEDVFLPEKHLEFLTKILSSCNLNIGDVAIVNDGIKAVDITVVKQQLHPNHILLFGIEPTSLRLPFNFTPFKLQLYAESVYLSVPSLNILNTDSEEGKLLKTKLWVCLKTMFEMSETIK